MKKIYFHGIDCVVTSVEIYVSIFARHGDDLSVFSSFSNPEESHLSKQLQMETVWGFCNADYPLMAHRVTWDKGEKEYKRYNEVHEYYLCIPAKEEDDD